jgi:hypothetical protein
VQTLRRLREEEALSAEDHRYFHRQAWRRLASAGLMTLLAGLLAGSLFFENYAQQLADDRQAEQAKQEPAPLAPDERNFIRFYYAYWIVTLLTLLALVTTALFDFWAIRRYGQRHFRQLQADRRAMIERQAAQLRQQRNGQAGLN